MSLSMHQASVPVFTQLLTAMSGVIDIAAAHFDEKGVDQASVMEMRLAPDMFTFVQQVQRATYHASNAVAKLAQLETPDFDDNQTGFDDLKARIAWTITNIASIDPALLDGSEDRTIENQVRIGVLVLPGLDFLQQFALPQVFFHTTTAYDILRNAGVQIGKKDFLGPMPYREMQLD